MPHAGKIKAKANSAKRAAQYLPTHRGASHCAGDLHRDSILYFACATKAVGRARRSLFICGTSKLALYSYCETRIGATRETRSSKAFLLRHGIETRVWLVWRCGFQITVPESSRSFSLGVAGIYQRRAIERMLRRPEHRGLAMELQSTLKQSSAIDLIMTPRLLAEASGACGVKSVASCRLFSS
jgi:hypothetical protein